MEYHEKGSIDLERGERQERNSSWWTRQTMSYDWKDKIELEPYSLEWFKNSDQRFLHAARLFTGEANPFPALMNLSDIAGKTVLEIGCGMGYHSELLARAGANLISIDISPTSVEATKKRFSLQGLSGDIRLADAEKLAEIVDRESVDMIWSWGVLHHSAHTARIIKHLSSLLKPDGSLKMMVYHLGGGSAYYTMLKRYLTGFWMGRDLDDMLWKDADGFTARFYTKDSLSDMMLAFFNDVNVRVFGQDADAMMLPRIMRGQVLKFVSKERQIRGASQRGSMIYAEARKPF